MPDAPSFTVVVATFDRGPHIIPTLESALAQTFRDFELLIVCDGPTDETLHHVPQGDARVRVIGLPEHSGSQAAPNNAGIAAARGRYIAYLGHDDIWMPDHLAALSQLFEETRCDIAVSGCAYHGPPHTNLVQITGIFETSDAARRNFFPPTSFAHRALLAMAIGGWRAPETISPPVDADFLLRAADSGARFVSTRRVTAHKFAAGHRYLSYLDPSSLEQEEMLAAIRAGRIDRQACATLVERAKTAGTFMPLAYPDFSLFRPGELYRQNRSNKGIDRAAVIPLTEEVYLPQTMEPRALDWHVPEPCSAGALPLRWSGPSLRPKLLIPFSGDVEAEITLHIHDNDPVGIIDDIRLTLNGHPVPHSLRRDIPNRVDLKIIGRLRPERASIVELILPRDFSPAEISDSPDVRRFGVILAGLTIAPTIGSL